MISIEINGLATGAVYISWTPQACSIGFDKPQSAPESIVLKCISHPSSGAVKFMQNLSVVASSTLNVTLPADGSKINFFIAGSEASTSDQDLTIQAVDSTKSSVLASRTLMVRIRKNANTLTPSERDRFLHAFASFNLSGGSPTYKDFLDMHNANANNEIHSGTMVRYSFLPWHRFFVLDLERQLQKIDPSVTIPYWKFDSPAPNLFNQEFMGAEHGTGTLQFSPSNPLISWTINGKVGVVRPPLFPVQTSPANIPGVGPIPNEANTIAMGSDFSRFRNMENSPHGYAHVSFRQSAPLTDFARAPEDPLFFLLHCNVDRLWALWQAVNDRYDIKDVNTYPSQGVFDPVPGKQTIGDYLDDTMWPWNGAKGGTRPPTAPGGQFPQITVSATPSITPKVWEAIDYQGYNGGHPSYADYDTVNFNPPKAIKPLPHFENMMEEFRQNRNDALAAHENHAKQFALAKSPEELNRALKAIKFIDPDNQELIKKGIDLVDDITVNLNLRLSALEKLTAFIQKSQSAIMVLFSILRDATEPTEIRLASLQNLSAISFNSPALNALMAEYKQVLRELVIKVINPQIREMALEILASYRDLDAQKILLDGLQNHEKAYVSDQKAIQLLGLDMRADFYPTIRSVLGHTNNRDVMIEAITALSGDPESREVIEKILANKKTDKDVRLVALSALNSMNPVEFQPILKTIVGDDSENSSLRAASLNMLSLHQNQTELNKDTDFNQKVEDLKNVHDIDLKKTAERFMIGRDPSKK